MGKQRNRRNKNGQQDGKKGKPKRDSATPPDVSGSIRTENPSAILLKIRHADPHTRLAALTALSDHPPNRRNMLLWQAVREQVMDSNLTVACMAATCLQAFLLLPPPTKKNPQSSTMTSSSEEESPNMATAGWYLILLGRVQEAYTQLRSDPVVTSTKSNSATKSINQKQQWLSLALACLSTITCLVQENPVVCERLERTPSLRKESFETFWQWLSYTIPTTVDEELEIITSQKQQIQEQVCDLLHMLMEDNPGVVEPWYEEETVAAQNMLKSAWQLVVVEPFSVVAAAASKLSPLSRLHLIGVLLAAFSQLTPVLEDTEKVGWGAKPLLESLKSYLRLPEDSTAQKYNRAALSKTYQQAQEQQQDSTLETTVVKQQNIKKEPARAIARRLKQQQRQQSSTTAPDDNDDDGKNSRSGSLPENRTDHVQEWQLLLNDWRQQHVVLELALEMTANVTSGLGAGGCDDDDQEWMQVEKGPYDSVICEVFHSQVPVLHHLLNQLTAHMTPSSNTGEKWPPVIAQHWVELQSKVAACLSHLLAMPSPAIRDATMDTSDKDPAFMSLLWKDLVRALENKQPAVVGTMVVALQSQPQLLSNGTVQPGDVNLFLSILDQSCGSCTSSDSQTDENSSRPAVVEELQTSCRDLIMLVGMILCQQKHSREMNYRVCQSLIKGQSSSSATVVAESLNTLMDIYGEDDCHPDVFDELHVLQHFQTSLPSLKHKISIATQYDNLDSEYMKEVVSNASHFIQYKKGHLTTESK